MKSDPRMSPLYIADWTHRKPNEKDEVIDALEPKSKLQTGDSFQVQADGSFLPLTPGDRVPDRPVRAGR